MPVIIPIPRAHELDARHQRPGDKRSPQKRSAKLRPDNRVGRDA